MVSFLLTIACVLRVSEKEKDRLTDFIRNSCAANRPLLSAKLCQDEELPRLVWNDEQPHCLIDSRRYGHSQQRAN